MPSKFAKLFAVAALSLLSNSCLALSAPGILQEDLDQFELIPDEDADCGGFEAAHSRGWNGHPMFYDSLEEEFESADFVAVVKIDAILPARYWTPTGAPPSDVDDHGMAIFRPVALRVEEVLKGDPGTTGLVVSKLGGCDRRNEFKFWSEPESIVGEHGDRALIFALGIPDWGDDPPGWSIQLEHAATVRSGPGETYAPFETANWVRSVWGNAEGLFYWPHEPKSFGKLLERVRDLSADR